MASNLRVDNIQPSTGTGIGIGTANGSVAIIGDLSVDTSKGLTVGTGATIFSPSSNVLALGTNNAERVKINSNGTVVVRGPSNPADYTLSNGIFVQPGNGLSALTIVNGSATDNAYINFSKGTASHTEQFAFAIGRDGTNNQGVVLVDNAVAARFGSTGIVMPSGKGIDFSAASGSAAGSTSALLDDYEEGTFTPTDVGGGGLTYTTALGHYVKIGNIVNVQLRVRWPTTSNTSSARVSLPFTGFNPSGANVSDGATAGAAGYISGGSVIPQIHTSGSSAEIYFYNFGGQMNNSNFSGLELRFGIVYRTS